VGYVRSPLPQDGYNIKQMAVRQNPLVSRRIAMLNLAGLTQIASGAPVRSSKLTGKTIQGETLDQSTLKGRPVLVQFWATWCTFCQSDEGAVEAIVNKFSPKGLVVVAVNAYEPRQKVQEYLVKHPRACKIALLEETNLAPLLTGRNYPVYILYDRTGNPIGEQRGASGESSLRRFIQRAGL